MDHQMIAERILSANKVQAATVSEATAEATAHALIAIAKELRSLNAILHDATDLDGAVKVAESTELLEAVRGARAVEPSQ